MGAPHREPKNLSPKRFLRSFFLKKAPPAPVGAPAPAGDHNTKEGYKYEDFYDCK